jgi:hypothetical protein
MNTTPTVFAQIIAFLPLHEFRKCVRRYRGDYKIKTFSCLDQFLCLAFAQLTYRESLRDIVACLRTMKHRLYHMGIHSNVSRNNLAHANETRDWRIFADFARVLIAEAHRLYQDEDLGLDLQNTVYAFDSTTIDLCLSLFPWAFFRKRKGAIKLHTLLDLRGSIPTFVHMTDGKTHDVRILDELPLEAGAFYLMDRLTFLTNNILLPALMITQLYKLRWQVELFFCWIKQNLRIKSFYATSENAVRTQIWVAITVYALVAVIKKRLPMDLPLYTFMQILSVTAFEKLPLNQLLTETDDHESMTDGCNQLVLFNL